MATGKPTRGGGKVVPLAGTAAPGVVDAWSRLTPTSEFGNSRWLPFGDLRDSLPADLAGADPGLASRVRSVRLAGISAIGLTSRGVALERGLTSAATFSSHDLPLAGGREFLDFAVGRASDSRGGLAQAKLLHDRFESAENRRDSFDDYEEKLEKYEEDLKKYQEKLDEYAKKQKKEKKKNGGGDTQAQDPDKNKGDGEKKDGPPKRPKRPKEPARDPALDLILKAIDGDLAVRVEAQRARDIAQLIALKEKYDDLELIILGGAEADLLADELVEAEIAVVLQAAADVREPGAPDRSFSTRYTRLRDAGVTVAIGSGQGASGSGFLLMYAGQAIAAGADEADVWASLTTVPAELLGLNETHGRLGRDTSSDVILFEGTSPFDVSQPMKSHSTARGFE